MAKKEGACTLTKEEGKGKEVVVWAKELNLRMADETSSTKGKEEAVKEKKAKETMVEKKLLESWKCSLAITKSTLKTCSTHSMASKRNKFKEAESGAPKRRLPRSPCYKDPFVCG